jgi:hypothetical protein
MAGTITRGKVLRADLAQWDGKTATATRIDATGGTLTGLAIGDQVDILQVYGEGTNRNRATIVSALTYIGSNRVGLVFAPGTWEIDANLTIPSNIACSIPAGCLIKPANGVTVTFNGPVVAGDYKIFDTSDSGVFAGLRYATPQWFGAVGDDSTNDWDAFDKAFRYSAVVRVPSRSYLVQGTVIDIRDGHALLFEGAQIRHTDIDGTIFRAVEKSDFTVLGKVILKGTLTVAATNSEVGLYIEKCKRFRLEGVEARLFTGKGLHLSGGTTIPGNFRGERGQFTDCAAYENTVGLLIDAGAASEYNTWTNFQCAGNVRGIDVAAGNNTFVGGNVVDNTEGVYVRNGSNHAHGIFSGVNINHNTSFNIKCEGVTNGQTFVGCHVYGDSAFAGYIWFVNSKGCQVINGTIDAPIQCDGTTGLNFITGNFIAGATNPVISGTDPEKLILRTNYTGTAPWGLDDPADVYVQATRGTSTQSLTTGNTEVVVFNNEEEDNRSAFDPTTGIFTAPYTGRYQFICTMYLTGASGMSATFMEFYKNNTTTINFGSLVYNATNVLGTMTLDINMDAGDTMRVRVTSNGVTPVVAVDKTRFMAKLLH